ncbi:MAG: hypothetical protein GX409_09455, partial [candidate division Zixibacteria bacterium]|nr:hypothetical protein [candidate division Zixibacteria bacterium]
MMAKDDGFANLTGEEILDKIESSGISDITTIPGDLISFEKIDSKPFRIAMDKFKVEGNDQKVKEMGYEILLFDFTMKIPSCRGEREYKRFSPKIVWTNDECYTDIKNIDDEAMQYYKARGEQTKNITLKVRYCDFTWEYLKDHNHARMAVEGYLFLLDKYYENNINHKVIDCL